MDDAEAEICVIMRSFFVRTAVLFGLTSVGSMLRLFPISSSKLTSRTSFLFSSSSSVSTKVQRGDGPNQPKKSSKERIGSGKYSSTVILPSTTLNQRANSFVREPELQKWWEDNDIYGLLSENNTGSTFVLHDGPPYANGDLHIGHALNKILKDIINKYQLLQGRRVKYVPGWDCHGLPIELKVLQSMSSTERRELTPLKLRKKAAKFAKETVGKQMISFKRYGVWGDWKNPYLTLDSQYESRQIRVFGEMFSQGHIYRGKKPVYWSPSSRTALAEAELEYPDNHVSRSVYVSFSVEKLSESLSESLSAIVGIKLLVWTTTPWTIPANLGIAVNPVIDYCIVSHPSVDRGTFFIVAKELIDDLKDKFSLASDFDVLQTMKGADLIGTAYLHPLYDRISFVLEGGDYITTESGTGLVHTAPGHGQEDYQTGLKYDLPLISPVNDLGEFTREVDDNLRKPFTFSGLHVLGDGNHQVIKALNESNALIFEESYKHKYPYDWRTKKPVILRATEQWFASISSFLPSVLSELDNVNFVPEIGRNRLKSMISSRGDWCISRQRQWGVPIPVFYKKSNNEPLITAETLTHIENVFSTHGSDAWWEMSVESLLPESLRVDADLYTKGVDTMDVWFDSGTSWAGVVESRLSQQPADLYLEGSDQHRGWFQSSLLTSVASRNMAPYRTILTHGFVLDEQGYKMSKSMGNVMDPTLIIEGGENQKENPAYGADTLRLWVSGVDYSTDVCVGKSIIKQVSETLRKLRNTMRFLIGNLCDFNPAEDAVPIDDLPSIDRYILGKLSVVIREVKESYDEYQFYRANQAITQFTNIDLSSFYLDISKDRLYISKYDDFRRRACQTVIHQLLEQLTVAIAPIAPHMAEDVWLNIPYENTEISIFHKGWVPQEKLYPLHDVEKWNMIRLFMVLHLSLFFLFSFSKSLFNYSIFIMYHLCRSLRNDVNAVIERARQSKLVGSSQETQVYLYAEDSFVKSCLLAFRGDDDFLSAGCSTNEVDDLRFILLVSRVTIVDDPEEILRGCPEFNLCETSESGVHIGVKHATGKKCERCWYFSDTVEKSCEIIADPTYQDVCSRCEDVLMRITK